MSLIFDSISKLVSTLGQGNFIISLSLLAVIFALYIIYKRKNKEEPKNYLFKIENRLNKLSQEIKIHIDKDDFYNKENKEKFSKIYDEIMSINTKLSIWIDSTNSLENKIDKINVTTQIISNKGKK